MLVLGIETSCDETAVAVVDDHRRIHAQSLLSQMDRHADYGGVVPEVAARAHAEMIDIALSAVMDRVDYGILDGVAATCGPGLIGGVLVGAAAGKAIAAVHNIPFIAVNHLEGHALSARLDGDCPFPYLLLLISGGHSQILIAEAVGRYHMLGRSLDDALGEAFDKAARLLGLGYPGGPAIETAAKQGDGNRFGLPRPLLGRPGCDFSFSGLKTALRRQVEQCGDSLDDQVRYDLAAAFQTAVGDCLVDRIDHACQLYRRHRAVSQNDAAKMRLVVAGGVAANRFLKQRLATVVADHGGCLIAPPAALCTDNAAMIAWAGIERLQLGLVDSLDVAARPRWPLASLSSVSP